MFAYRNQEHPSLENPIHLIIFLLAILFYSVLFAGVAIEFPKGLIFGYIYLSLYALPLSIYLYFTRDRLQIHPQNSWRSIINRGQRLVLQFYLGSYVLAFIIMIGWSGKYGIQSREDAGVPL